MSELLDADDQPPEAVSQAQMMTLMAEMLEAMKRTDLLLAELIAATIDPSQATAVLKIEDLSFSPRAVR